MPPCAPLGLNPDTHDCSCMSMIYLICFSTCGLCQVNLEYLGRVVFNSDGMLYPDSLVGTDSHTTMINGLGIVGWGKGYSWAGIMLINPWCARAVRVTVCVCVCLSVKSHLTSGASVHPENTVVYSVGNGGPKICVVFSETAPLQRSSTPSVEDHTYSQPFSCGKRTYLPHVAPRFLHFSAFIFSRVSITPSAC